MKYVKINNKCDCCGCSACYEICPNECIEMLQDDMGFAYPCVDVDKCVNCGRCTHVCSFKKLSSPNLPIKCYAAVNADDNLRLSSSSGGVFITLANRTISRGGVVFGAVFSEEWKVIHTYAETTNEIQPMMGSKYVQSEVLGTFSQVKTFLLEGRNVLYTGTPCQIAGLKHYLGKDYPELLTVEVICHGVPSPKVWQSYLKDVLEQLSECQKQTINESTLKKISFRSKKQGWKLFGFEIETKTLQSKKNAMNIGGSEGINTDEKKTDSSKTVFFEPYPNNLYMSAFLRNWSIRPSCFACKAKAGASLADITIGDFWGIEKTGIVEDDKGISCVICRTPKGINTLIELENLKLTEVDYDIIYRGNPVIEKSVSSNYSARYFHKRFPRKGFFDTMKRLENPPLPIKVLKKSRNYYFFLKRKIKQYI